VHPGDTYETHETGSELGQHRPHLLLAFVRARGQTRCEAHTLACLAQTAVLSGRRIEAAEVAASAAGLALEIRDRPLTLFCLLPRMVRVTRCRVQRPPLGGRGQPSGLGS